MSDLFIVAVFCVLSCASFFSIGNSLEKACANIGNGTNRLGTADQAWTHWQSTNSGSKSSASAGGPSSSPDSALGGAIEAVNPFYGFESESMSAFCFRLCFRRYERVRACMGVDVKLTTTRHFFYLIKFCFKLSGFFSFW